MRLLVPVALLSSLAGAAALSGTLKTPANSPLAGATVSLAVAGTSTFTAADGSWRLGGTTGLGRSGASALRATRHLSVVNGRIRLDWNGRDIAGRVESRTSMPKATAVPVSVAGRSAGAKVDTLVFAWRGARIAALPVDMDSAYDLRMRLDTLTAPAPQSVQVRAVRSTWGGVQMLNCLLTSPGTVLQGSNAVSSHNYGQVHQDSLTLRLFVRSKDTLSGTHYLSTSTGVSKVPVLFRNSMAVRYDLCQVFDTTGFNRPCNDPVTGKTWNWGSVNSAVQLLWPERIENSYDPASGTWLHAIDLPLGPAILPVGGKLRFDVQFVVRDAWSGVLTQASRNLLDTLVPYLPGRAIPSVGEMGWWYAYAGAAPHTFAASDSAALSLDWSFMTHSVRNGSPVDFSGLPKAASPSEADALFNYGGMNDLNPWTRLDPNPYICVYRKGTLVSGYPPVPGRD